TDWSDMVICDRYPTEDYFRNLQYNFIHHAKAESGGKKPVWTLYQTSQMDGRYERTAAKHRNMIYQGMFAGGNSIGYISVSARDSQGTGITSVTEVYEAAKDIIAT
ncbi:MAG: hypothetical protein IKB55_01620, partial [Clostridia bacterium]|nr:hypothetical protein [Clostridia bacterium]